MNPDLIEEKIPHYAKLLKSWFELEDWKMLVKEEIKRTTFLGNNPPFQTTDLAKTTIPVHYRIGDKDNIAIPKFTKWANQHTPNSTFGVIPDSAHPVLQINLDYLKKDLISK